MDTETIIALGRFSYYNPQKSLGGAHSTKLARSSVLVLVWRVNRLIKFRWTLDEG